MRKINAWMRSYFAFSRTETRGALLLLFFTLVALGLTHWVSIKTAQPPPLSEKDWHVLDSLVAVLEREEEPFLATPRPRVISHPFNPNTADSATLTQLGLKPWVARRVVNYRQKGGRFRIKADFKKIYGLPDTTYQRLYAYLQLPEERAARKRTAPTARPVPVLPKAKEAKHLSLNINTADTALLKQLPGIGSVLASRIVKYRRKLGGYHSLAQLQEVYHMTERGAVSVRKSTYVAEDHPLRRLNINEADATILAQHPYISWDLARALVRHRQDYGEFRSLDDLREVYLMNEKVLEKITPYLEI